MYLRWNTRNKDGKQHRYFSVVESRRVNRGEPTQRTALYLGEINDSQEAVWRKTLEVFDEAEQRHSGLSLFPDEGEVPPEAVNGLQVKLNEMELHRPRASGDCWLSCELWRQLGLDEFWDQRLGAETKRERAPWEKVLRHVAGKRYLLRSETTGTAGKLFQARGVGLPAVIRPC